MQNVTTRTGLEGEGVFCTLAVSKSCMRADILRFMISPTPPTPQRSVTVFVVTDFLGFNLRVFLFHKENQSVSLCLLSFQ